MNLEQALTVAVNTIAGALENCIGEDYMADVVMEAAENCWFSTTEEAPETDEELDKFQELEDELVETALIKLSIAYAERRLQTQVRERGQGHVVVPGDGKQ